MNNKQTADIIRILCRQRRVTIRNVLDNCGINRNFIYDLEKAEKVPAADKLESIADYLDCSMDYLLGRTDNPDVNQ